jgi:hypothetical protein
VKIVAHYIVNIALVAKMKMNKIDVLDVFER